ncbi:unnamed protein product [Vicia faba]|uniref:Retrotransposon gag domain-containing protein n=1 Tax=Vicia faba TaxID=3906 RepID=A0AAV1B660_VICFA|nr:unnamed protein product [Vicia faba]
MRKYYPEDVRGKKEIEFLELKQGSMSITDYAARIIMLAKFYPHYDGSDGEYSKCIKFENGLRPEIKKVIGYQKIRVFSDLIDSCESLRRTVMLIIRLCLIRETKFSKAVENRMILQLVKGNKKRFKGEELVGEMLLLVLFVTSVGNLATKVMFVEAMLELRRMR